MPCPSARRQSVDLWRGSVRAGFIQTISDRSSAVGLVEAGRTWPDRAWPDRAWPNRTWLAARHPTARGPTARGPNTRGPNTRGPTARRPTARGPTAHGPTARGSTARRPNTRGPTARGPTARGWPWFEALVKRPQVDVDRRALPLRPSHQLARLADDFLFNSG